MVTYMLDVIPGLTPAMITKQRSLIVTDWELRGDDDGKGVEVGDDRTGAETDA